MLAALNHYAVLDSIGPLGDNDVMESQTLIVALEDSSRGYDIFPGRVPLDVLRRFAKEVQDFIRGSDLSPISASPEVAVVSGSLALSLQSAPPATLLHDIQSLTDDEDTSRIDPKRRAVVDLWQEYARRESVVSIRIAATAVQGTVRIDSRTDYRDKGNARLVNVERYIRGEIQDLGGTTKPNAHVRLADGRLLTVRISKSLIQAQSENLVYKDVELRVRAKLNLDTNELSDVELISFEHYEPRMERRDFETLLERGRMAWADVEDPAQWVRDLRGGNG